MQALRLPASSPVNEPNLLLQADPRLKLLMGASLGLMLWICGLAGLICIGLLLLPGFLLLARAGRLQLQMPAAVATFAGFWSLAAFGLQLWEGAALHTALGASLFLGARLALLLLLGLLLTLSSSARELGLGLSWLLRPVAGKRAWQLALAVALLLHFLPQTLETLAQVRRMLQMRGPKRPLWTRFGLMAQTVLRIMAQNAWKQTVALAGRGLDSPAAWRPVFEPQPLHWLTGCSLVLVCVGVCAASWAGGLPA